MATKKTTKKNAETTFIVEVHWNVARTFKIPACTREEAEKIMNERIAKGEVNVWTDHFEAQEDYDVASVGYMNNGEEEFFN